MTRVLLVTQAYPPDTPAVGQYFQDAARSIAERGHAVTVLASGRSYEGGDPLYASSDEGGVAVVRIPLGSLGKGSVGIRLLGALLFQAQVLARVLLARFDVLVVTTTPPLVAVGAAIVCFLRRRPMVYWVMDVNPEQFIALYGRDAASATMRLLRTADRFALRRAAAIVVLDEPMRRLTAAKLGREDARIEVIPPWPMAEFQQDDGAARRFREAHGVAGDFVVMYSGNHSFIHPLDSVLQAARLLATTHPRIRFMFVGGGNAKGVVERCGLPNVLSLPYQPLEQLGASLGAADLHLVIVGDASVGLVHPSKIYAPMALGLPVLVVGPPHAPHVMLVKEHQFGWAAPHGTADALIMAILEAEAMTAAARALMGDRGRAALVSNLKAGKLRGRFVDVILEAAARLS